MKLKNVLIVVNYFEESSIEGIAKKLDEYKEPITHVNRMMEHYLHCS